MADNLLTVYHRLPYPMKVVVASTRGYILRLERYDRETEQIVERVLERENWSAEKWKNWREEKLAFVLHRAATTVPYYRDLWNKRRAAGDRRASDLIQNWPFLSKETLRQHPKAFVADDRDTSKMIHERTSGSTSTPLDIWISMVHNKEGYAIFEARCKRWYGVDYHDRWGMIGGQLVTPVERRKPPFWVWNQGLNQLYMSSYHLAPDLIPAYLEAIQSHHLTYIYGYSSSLYQLGYTANERGVKLDLKVAIADAEPLFDYQRETISRAFGCPTRITYGCTENVISAQECEEGNLHLWPELGVLEVADWDTETILEPGESGRFICTSLLNTDMPLIRYELGDCGSISLVAQVCACGRSLPILGTLEGRIGDTLYTKDGRRVSYFSSVFKLDVNIKEAQIVQEDLDHIRLRFVPASGFSKKDEQAIADSLRLRLGETNIQFEQVDFIPRGKNGKFRAVVGLKNLQR
jgi:phenylacetate-CoA ligase